MAISQKYINQSPSLYLNFDRSNQLDPRVSVSRASSATYIDAEGMLKTVGPNEPRFNYENGECKGLLIEESRTNVIKNSSNLNGSNWYDPYGTITVTNVDYYQKLEITADVANIMIYRLDNSVVGNIAPNRLKVCYADMKAGNVKYGYLARKATYQDTNDQRIIFDLESGTVVSDIFSIGIYGTIYLGNGFYRCWAVTQTIGSTSVQDHFGVGICNSKSDSRIKSVGDYIYVARTQYETAANTDYTFPTSYIPTTSTTVTRAADKVTINDLSWFDDNEGTFVVDTVLTENQRLGFSTTTTLFSVDNGTSQICLDTVKVNVGTGDTLYNLVGEKNIVGYSSARNIIATDGGLPILVGIASTSYISNASTTTGSISGMNRLALGWDPFNSNANLNGSIKSFRYYPSLLDDNQIESLVKKDLEIPSPTLVTNSMVNKVYVTGITTITNGDVNGFYQFKGTMNTFGCGNPSSAVFIELKDDINWSKMICQFEMTGGASCWSFNGGGSSTGSTGGPEVNPSAPGFIPGGNMEPYNEDLGDRIFKDINAYSSNPIFKRQLSACDGSVDNGFRNLDNPNVQSFWTYCRRKNKSSGLAGPFHSKSCTGIGYYILIKNIYIF